MTLKEIRNSGLLELYVLGDIDAEDKRLVSACLKKYPELKQDLKEIEFALLKYAEANAIEAPKSTLQNVLDSLTMSNSTIKNSENKAIQNNYFYPLAATLLLATFFLGWKNYQASHKLESQNQVIIDCETEKNNQLEKIALLDYIVNNNTKAVNIEASERYTNTKLTLYTNNTLQKNIIKVDTLPDIDPNQTFQLWSLDGDGPPKPMDVFLERDQVFIETGYNGSSQAYAITIEKTGGSEVPNLEQLIGVFNVNS